MSFRELRWAPVLVILTLTVGLLMGANSFYHRAYIDTPMKRIMDAHPEVKSWSLDKEGKQNTLTVKLGTVDNLLETCTIIQKEVEPYLGKDGWQMRVTDERSDDLEQVFYSMQYVVYEALTQGNFTFLADTLKREAARAGLDSSAIYVNSYNLYIQMKKDGVSLYEVLPRKVDDKPPVLIIGGSE
ncbi:MAG: hypothetical protein HPY50_16020 [Firmicutes bacterium]|nr:hypothetical protein [Bacillota bacterium]